MPEYRVLWEIDVDAENEREAAESVRAMYFKLTGACVFNVINHKNTTFESGWEQIDLAADPENDQPVWRHEAHTLREMARQILDEGGDVNEIMDMLEKPWNWNDVLSRAILAREFDKVSPGTDEEDLSVDIDDDGTELE